MRRTAITTRGIAFALALALGAAPALAGKPDGAGQGNSGKSKGNGAAKSGNGSAKSGKGSPQGHDHDDHGGVSFSSPVRVEVRDWYETEYRGHCPPGLAKKNNGCLPPGQAKKRYAIGHPLPPGIVIGVVPPSLAVILGPPPHGYRYGMVDGDVVKLAVGTALVVDAIQGLMD